MSDDALLVKAQVLEERIQAFRRPMTHARHGYESVLADGVTHDEDAEIAAENQRHRETVLAICRRKLETAVAAVEKALR